MYLKSEKDQSARKRACPECGGMDFMTDPEAGETVCTQCGLVLQEQVLTQMPEWRVFTPDQEETKIRVGPPSSFKQFNKGLSTTFQPYKDIHGKYLPMKERLRMQRLLKWNVRTRIYSSAERNLSKALSMLTRLTDKLHIPEDVSESAALIYRRALDRGLVRGRSIECIAAASLYAACRITSTPRSLKEIAEASLRGPKEISKCYRLLQQNLEMKVPLDDPVKYVSKVASRAELSPKTLGLATQILQKTKEINGSAGKGPAGMAAAALYVAALMNGEKVTQKRLAEAASVTEVTIKNRYKGITRAFPELKEMNVENIVMPRL